MYLFGPWQFRDRFGEEWSFTLVPPAESKPVEQASWEHIKTIEHLVFQAFSHGGATDDALARVFLEVYDALSNRRLSRELPRPSNDPKRLLRNFDRELRQFLRYALAADVLRIEKMPEKPWPFRDWPFPEEPVPPHLDVPSPDEQTTFIAIRLVDQNGDPVPDRRYRIALASGPVLSEGRLDANGSARVDGLDPSQCVITFPDIDEGTAVTGLASGAGDAVPAPAPDELTWVAVQMTGDALAYTGLAYELTTPDGNVHSGTLDASGLVRVDGVPPGLCKLRFPDKADGDILQTSGSA